MTRSHREYSADDNTAELDRTGTITSVNHAWRRFAKENGYVGNDLGLGSNYISICDNAVQQKVEDATKAKGGIKKILNGESTSYIQDYPCHSPNEQRWFKLVAVPRNQGNEIGASVIHINTTKEFLRRKELEDLFELFEDIAELATQWYWETNDCS